MTYAPDGMRGIVSVAPHLTLPLLAQQGGCSYAGSFPMLALLHTPQLQGPTFTHKSACVALDVAGGDSQG